MSRLITDEIILDIVDKGLAALGESPKQAMWYHLEKDFKFERQKVPENLEAFEGVLQKFFGLGYSFLESLFRQQLREATGEDLKGYKTFVDCVRGLRAKAKTIKYKP